MSVKRDEGDQERVRRILFVAGREDSFLSSSVRKRDTAKYPRRLLCPCRKEVGNLGCWKPGMRVRRWKKAVVDPDIVPEEHVLDDNKPTRRENKYG